MGATCRQIKFYAFCYLSDSIFEKQVKDLELDKTIYCFYLYMVYQRYTYYIRIFAVKGVIENVCTGFFAM